MSSVSTSTYIISLEKLILVHFILPPQVCFFTLRINAVAPQVLSSNLTHGGSGFIAGRDGNHYANSTVIYHLGGGAGLASAGGARAVSRIDVYPSGWFPGFRVWKLKAFANNGNLIAQENEDYGSFGNAAKFYNFNAKIVKAGFQLTDEQVEIIKTKMSI